MNKTNSAHQLIVAPHFNSDTRLQSDSNLVIRMILKYIKAKK
jgi:hypothetical protein